MDELKIAIKSIKYSKACGLDNNPGEVKIIYDFNDILLQLCNAVYFRRSTDKWRKECMLTIPSKRRSCEAFDYRGITLTSVSPKF